MSKEFIRAAKNGDVYALKRQFAEDATQIGWRDVDQSTALHCACWKGHIDCVAFLIESGADVNAVNENDHWGTTPLHAAAHANQGKIAEMLIAAGADVNAKDQHGQTPLAHTAFHKATAAAKVLRTHGAN